MKYKIVNLDALTVVGKERHLNFMDPTAPKKIDEFWGEFFAKNTPDTLPNMIQPMTTLGIYTNYDKTANYSIIIGCPVSSFDNSLNNNHTDLINFTIPAAKYAVFTVAGPFPKAIADFWTNLWSNIWTNKDNLDFQRTFTVDFELYDARYMSEKPEIDIYIAIK